MWNEVSCLRKQHDSSDQARTHQTKPLDHRTSTPVVPEKFHTHPMEGHWKFLRGGGVLKAKFLEAMYENKLEFPGGGSGGLKNKKPPVWGMWIFSGTSHCVIILELKTHSPSTYFSLHITKNSSTLVVSTIVGHRTKKCFSAVD